MDLKKPIYIGISLVLIFTLFYTLVLPQFKVGYETGTNPVTGVNPYCLANGSMVSCTNCNFTSGSGYASFLDTCHHTVSATNNTDCWSCTNFGYRTEVRGLYVLIFVLALLFSAIGYLKMKK